jgi:hypothetical protein
MKGALMESIYFWFSFLSLGIRTFVMVITIADLHGETKKPLRLLKGIQNGSWNEEVKIIIKKSFELIIQYFINSG